MSRPIQLPPDYLTKPLETTYQFGGVRYYAPVLHGGMYISLKYDGEVLLYSKEANNEKSFQLGRIALSEQEAGSLLEKYIYETGDVQIAIAEDKSSAFSLIDVKEGQLGEIVDLLPIVEEHLAEVVDKWYKVFLANK